MTCKDCIHSDLCGTFTRPRMPDEANASERLCKDFKNKADYAEVKHGEWIEGKTLEKCSLCGKKGFSDWHYCPACGAKMDGRSDT